ncbi:MAG: hypothetical protein ACREQP_10585 [Candidatus Binatia bacterium]
MLVWVLIGIRLAVQPAVCFRRALDIHPHLDAVRDNLALAEAEGGGSGYPN